MKKPLVFTGSGVAIITPFNEDLSINYNKLAELIDLQIDGGTDAIVICGTTGESATMTEEEHMNCIEFAVKHVNGRIPIIAGAGSNDTRTAITISQHAEKAGADALLIVTPYYNKATQSGLVKHYKMIAESVKLPIITYNVPSRTGTNIQPETYLELSKIPNIVATKEANGNISDIARTAALCGDDLYIYSGNDDQIVPILSLGGKGVISVLSNVVPRETHNICEYYFNGKVKESAALQLKMMKLIGALFCEVNPIPVKAAMKLLGHEVGTLRPPLFDISEKGLNSLTSAMKELSLI
ncbi:MAG: 4-hydroxy-tetrahydrodipicolinate synthase [Bacillota bacterium]|nr:4-hydroxy-tetrahydrodipicolinate synthase [Bacillota bacterium]